MTIHDLAELLSLGLTPPTMIFALLTVWMYFGQSVGMLRKGPQTSYDWLILGVAVAFAGSCLDNAWWGAAWSADFMEADSRDWLFANGVLSNIPFRQVAGIIAGYCHVRAAHQHAESEMGHRIANRWLWGSCGVGVAFAWALYLAKGGM